LFAVFSVAGFEARIPPTDEGGEAERECRVRNPRGGDEERNERFDRSNRILPGELKIKKDQEIS
jgi:hypothetical protein